MDDRLEKREIFTVKRVAMNGLVSVLMCVYNTPLEYLKAAINSILDQAYSDFEFIIVDDASDDLNVLEYLEITEKDHDCVILIHNEENLGLTRSLNIGLKACSGDYVARMDSDDIALPGRLSAQVDYLLKYPEVVLVGSNIICFDESNEDFVDNPVKNEVFNLEHYKVCSLIQHSGPPHPTFMFRAQYLKKNDIIYPEIISKAQDYGIMVEILKKGGEIRIIPEPLVKYRIHGDQITSKHEREQKIYQLKVSYDYIRYLFPELSDPECLSIAALGCPFNADDILEELKKNVRLRANCKFDPDSIKELNSPRTYIIGQKKLFRLNRKKQYFDQNILQAELGFRWWALAIRRGLKKKDHWGLSMYTLACARYSLEKKRRIR